jgi:hypothetical protein
MYFSNKDKQDKHIEMSTQFPGQLLQDVPNGLNAQIFLHNLRGKSPLLTEREGQNRHRQLPTSAHKCRSLFVQSNGILQGMDVESFQNSPFCSTCFCLFN